MRQNKQIRQVTGSFINQTEFVELPLYKQQINPVFIYPQKTDEEMKSMGAIERTDKQLNNGEKTTTTYSKKNDKVDQIWVKGRLDVVEDTLERIM